MLGSISAARGHRVARRLGWQRNPNLRAAAREFATIVIFTIAAFFSGIVLCVNFRSIFNPNPMAHVFGRHALISVQSSGAIRICQVSKLHESWLMRRLHVGGIWNLIWYWWALYWCFPVALHRGIRMRYVTPVLKRTGAVLVIAMPMQEMLSEKRSNPTGKPASSPERWRQRLY